MPRTVTVLADFQFGHQDVFNRSAFQRSCGGLGVMTVDTSDITMTTVIKAAVSEPPRRDVWQDDLEPCSRCIVARHVALLASVVFR